MSLSFSIKLYLATLGIFLAIDLLWLGLVARTLYRKYLGYLMSANVNWSAALLFYLIFITGLLIFVVIPALKSGSFSQAVWMGALFGLVTYATYDLTNLATIKDWPLPITLVDMLWGIILSVTVTASSFWLGRWLL